MPEPSSNFQMPQTSSPIKTVPLIEFWEIADVNSITKLFSQLRDFGCVVSFNYIDHQPACDNTFCVIKTEFSESRIPVWASKTFGASSNQKLSTNFEMSFVSRNPQLLMALLQALMRCVIPSGKIYLSLRDNKRFPGITWTIMDGFVNWAIFSKIKLWLRSFYLCFWNFAVVWSIKLFYQLSNDLKIMKHVEGTI